MSPEDYRALQAARAQAAALIDDRRRQAAARRQELGMEQLPRALARPRRLGRHFAVSAALLIILATAILLVGPLRGALGQ